MSDKPEIIEELSYEEIRNASIAELRRKEPDYPILESDPAVKVIEAVAYRELLLRARINDAARSNFLDYAGGKSLDALGDFYGVKRLAGESDDAYRQRISLFAAGGKGGGTADYYRYNALSVSARVKDCVLYRKGKSPVIYAAIFGDGQDGAADDQLIEQVSKELNSDKVKMVSDTIIVHSAVRVFVDIAADIWPEAGAAADLLERVKANIRSEWGKTQQIGRNITLAWLAARMMIDGVRNVKIAEPAEDVEVAPYEAAAIRDIALTLAGG